MAVLGHPNTLGLNGSTELENLTLSLLKEGLKGIEVYYPEHSSSEIGKYKALAEKHGLILTGGTDYHGIDKESLDVGVGRGEMKLPYSIVESLKAVRSRS